MPGQRKPSSWESPMLMPRALASWLGASIAPQKAMQSSKNLCLEMAFVCMLQRETGVSVRMLQMPCQQKALSSIIIITISLTVCYDPRNFDRLCYIEDDVVKWFRRLCASSAKRSVTRLNQTVYAKILTRKNFRRFNLSTPVVRYWSGASSSRFRQAKPRAE